jgi:hypothetical protein
MKFFLILFLLSFKTVWAQSKAPFVVEKIVNDKELVIRPLVNNREEFERIKVGSSFAIYGQDLKEVIAVAFVNKISSEKWVMCTVKVENTSTMIREGDGARIVRFDKENKEFDGNYNLVRNPDPKVQARYQHLTYLGYWAGHTSALIRKDEKLAGPTLLAYGLHNRVQIHTTPLLNLVQTYNLGTKINLIPEENYSFTVGLDYSIFDGKDMKPIDISLMFDSYASSNIMSYTKLSFYGERPQSNSYFTGGEQRFNERGYTAELQNYYGIMLKNWDRIFIGPKYNFDQRLLGGHISYAFIGKHSHFIAGIMTEDFSNSNFSSDAYRLIFDFYWRF